MHKYAPHMLAIGVGLLVVGVLIYLLASGTVKVNLASQLHTCGVALTNVNSPIGANWVNGYWYDSVASLSQATMGESPDPTDKRAGAGPICAIDYDPSNPPTAWALDGGQAFVPKPVYFTGAQQNYFYAYTDGK